MDDVNNNTGAAIQGTNPVALEPAISVISEQNPNNSVNKWIFFSLIFLIFITILSIFLVFYFSNSTIKLTAAQFNGGSSFNLEKGEKIKFNLLNESHSLIINSISANKVDITVNSKTINYNISLSEEKKFDIDENGKDDFKVKLNSILNKTANFTIKEISEKDSQSPNTLTNNSFNSGNVQNLSLDEFMPPNPNLAQLPNFVTNNSTNCTENWKCLNWMICLNGTQSRLCLDQNNCTNAIFKVAKPITNISCVLGIDSETDSASCTDSDQGKNYGVAGTTKDKYGRNYTDSCTIDSSGKDLSEWFCYANKSLGYENHTCAYKCNNSICVTPPTACTSGDLYCPSGCTYQQDNDCTCLKDIDCITENLNSAAKCVVGKCINSSVPLKLQVNGDLNGFCNSYINNCESSTIINLSGPNNIQAQVNGSSINHAGCNIKVIWNNGSNYIINPWVEMSDSVAACTHNVPIFFYKSSKDMCGSAPCYGEFP